MANAPTAGDSGTPKKLPLPPARISYEGSAGPHTPKIGGRVKVTLHGKVVSHSTHAGEGTPHGTLELSPHKMTVEPGEAESPAEEAAESPAEEAAETTPKTNTGSMVSHLRGIQKKYKPLRGTAGPMSGTAD